jgi:hypothetical protein
VARIPVEIVFATIKLVMDVAAIVSKVETAFVFPCENTPESSVIDPVLSELICNDDIFAIPV